MIKLLVCLFSAAVIAVALLQMRQQRLELRYQTKELHDQIRDQQAKLWGQQLQIATYTAPNAISKTVDGHRLKMVPEAPLPPGARHWIEQGAERD